MALLQQLQMASLKKVDRKLDETSISSASDKDLQNLMHRVREVDIENWYPNISDITYATEFIEITIEVFNKSFVLRIHRKRRR